MAGKTGVSLNWGGLDKVVGQAARSLADRKQLLLTIAETLKSGNITRFEEGVAPDGSKWEPSARAWKDGVQDGGFGKTLQNTGDLRNSVEARVAVTKDSVLLGSDTTKLGTNKAYAAIHQFGGKAGRGRKVTIPARPFVGISKEDLEEVQGTIADFLADAFKGKH